ncbi:hypothetical protein GMLC_33160 [Geomonas limicola]|uniref:Uncharacterized protein n=1 Tax=Geomonas limicola TaxID=2740186 RepID=A0A6V8ND65_9BACT|nr:hypothetical protein [Geomonas limicola]GFO69737.1 hypothetical protein GMLC_33160 [Geomonas limicola]
MASVQIDNLSPGMVLKKNVTDRSGRLLLPSGTALEPKHLNIFRMWGVLDVEVTDESEAEVAPDLLVPELDPELVARASAEVARIFAHNDPEHPVVRELMRICIRRRAAHEA